MSGEPITDHDLADAIRLLSAGLACYTVAYDILDRFAERGLVSESENNKMDRCRERIANLRKQIGDTNLLKCKLQRQAKRKREIEAQRRKGKGK